MALFSTMDILHMIATILNLIIGSSLLLIFINQRSTLLKTHTDYLTLAIILSGLLFSLSANINLDLHIILQRQTYALCQFSGTLVSFFTGTNQSIHSLIALERYIKIFDVDFRISRYLVLTKSFLDASCIFSTIFIMWISSDMVAFHPVESEMWCFYDFTSRNSLDLAASLIVGIFISVSTFVIIHCYLQIYRKVNKQRLQTTRILQQQTPKTQQPSKSLLQKFQSSQTQISQNSQSQISQTQVSPSIVSNEDLAKKFLIIASSYLLAYAPSYGTFLYRFVSRSTIPKEVEMFATYLTLCEPSITCFLLFYLNARYRKGFQRLFLNLEQDSKISLSNHQ